MSSAKSVCFYFQAHQPFRTNTASSTVVDPESCLQGPNPGKHGGDYSNRTIFEKVAQTCYLPATAFWLELFRAHPTLKLTLSLSGTLLEQCLLWPKYGDSVLAGFRRLLETGRVELLTETYYHSLVFFFSQEEYRRQIKLHEEILEKLFGFRPVAFRNTELIYNDELAKAIYGLGYRVTLAEGVNHNLKHVNRTNFHVMDQQDMKVLLRDFPLTSDLIFLSANWETFIKNFQLTEGGLINIFTDFEIFGEMNDPSVFEKAARVFDMFEEHNVGFHTVSEAADLPNEQRVYSSPEWTTWANTEHSIKTWRGNQWQEQAFEALIASYQWVQKLYDVLDPRAQTLLQTWRKLTTSDHFYYLQNLEGPDGEVHERFTPFTDRQAALDIYIFALNHVTQLIREYLNQPSYAAH